MVEVMWYGERMTNAEHEPRVFKGIFDKELLSLYPLKNADFTYDENSKEYGIVWIREGGRYFFSVALEDVDHLIDVLKDAKAAFTEEKKAAAKAAPHGGCWNVECRECFPNVNATLPMRACKYNGSHSPHNWTEENSTWLCLG